MRRQYYFILFFVFLGLFAEAQQYTKDIKPDPKFAKLCVEFHNYLDGLKEYRMLLADDPDNVNFRQGAALCMLSLNADKKQALDYMEWVVKQKKFDSQAYYVLGVAYLQNYRFDDAINAFKKFNELEEKDKNRISALRMIEVCNNAKKLVANPVNVEITNLGKYINSSYPDFNPYIPSNESMLLYNSQRKSNLGSYPFYDGYYASDVYVSYFKYGRWKKTRRLPSSVNSKNIEKVVGMTSDGANMFLIKEDIKGNKQTFYSKKRGKYYRDPKPIFIKDESYKKIYSLTVSPDNKYLVFSAEHKAGIGGKDLYLSFRMPNGYWSSAHILDSTVNTIYDEEYPYFSPDGQYFFFASEGHESMGGFDIFKAKWLLDSVHITSISNIGYPVNTPLDDNTISLSKSGRYGYLSSYRKGGFGDLDIYRVIFKDAQPKYSVVYGAILGADSLTSFGLVIKNINDHIDTLNFPINHEYKRLLLKKKDSIAAYAELAKKIPYEQINVKVLAINKETGETFGNFIARNDTSNYSVILPPGRWKLIFKRNGYKDYIVDDLLIEERDQRNRMIRRNAVMSQK